MKLLTGEELAENNNAIDAFQLYADTISIGRSEFNVLNSDGFYDALAYFLNTQESECPDCNQVPIDICGCDYGGTRKTDKEIATRLGSEFLSWCISNKVNGTYGVGEVMSYLWLDWLEEKE